MMDRVVYEEALEAASESLWKVSVLAMRARRPKQITDKLDALAKRLDTLKTEEVSDETA